MQLVDLVQAGQITPELARDIVGNAARLAWPNSPDKVQYDLASINAGLRAMTLADAEERLTGRRSLIARAMAPLLG